MSAVLRSLDYETHLVQRGLLTPPLVCGSAASWEHGADSAELLEREEAIERAREFLSQLDVIIAGANIAYDFAVAANEHPTLLPRIFAAYAEGRVHDVQIAQALDAIAGGHLFKEPPVGPGAEPSPLMSHGKRTRRYSLETCVRLTLGRDDAKANDFWRLRYAILEDVPLSAWPEDAVRYPKDDAWNTVEVAAHQLGFACERCGQAEALHSPGASCGHFVGCAPFRNMGDLSAQCETHFALHLGSTWGLRVDPERFATLESRVVTMHEAFARAYSIPSAHVFLRPDGTEEGAAVKYAVALAYGASGVCRVCNGSGKVRSVKRVPCRGTQVRKGGRWSECLLASGATWCSVCHAEGEVDKLGDKIICRAAVGGCDGTGLDLDTAPTLKRTDKGGIAADRDTLSESGDDLLAAYGDNEHEKVLETYIPALREGLDAPICLRPNVLLESGRASYEGIWQLAPRSCPACALGSGLCTCVRPCVRARPGRVLGSTDYEAGELCTLAQVCLWVCGASEMADTINRTKSPGALHTALGAKLLGVSYDEMVRRIEAGDKQAKRFRQAAKPFNFGAPGGMGAAKLVLTNRAKNAGTTTGPDGRVYAGIRFCVLVGGASECGTVKVTSWKRRDIPPTCKACLELAEFQLRPAWFEQWPEMRAYFEWVEATISTRGEIPCLGPDDLVQRVRGGVDFCAACNNGFQALLADAAKSALRAVTREAYIDHDSPLYHGVVRVPLFAHDELFSEGNADTAHLWGPRVAEIMVRELRRYVPDVYGAAETALMEFWYKDAKPKHDENGKLVIWRPK